MRPQRLSPVGLICLLGAISILPCMSCGLDALGPPEGGELTHITRGRRAGYGAGALLCYETTSSRFRAVSLHNRKWLLMRSMVCKLSEGCEETLVLIETGTRRGVVGFKGCSPASSYSPQVSYLVSPPGLSIASYSRVCRSIFFRKLPNLCGLHSTDCLPKFVTTDSCPHSASKCYSSTLKFQSGSLNTTFLLVGCAREYRKLLAEFHHIGSIRVTEVLSVLEKAQIAGAELSSQRPPWNDKAEVLSVVLTIPLPSGSGDPMIQRGSGHSSILTDEH
ncbi:hypothetical protein MC885_020907 [Smutsia gigantea]|nr:hypothetical protein MC885_020907 [Smutsia gigantea]